MAYKIKTRSFQLPGSNSSRDNKNKTTDNISSPVVGINLIINLGFLLIIK
jgi:hypothetical protein